MFTRLVPAPTTWLPPVLIVLTGVVLSGCMMDETGEFVDPARTAYYDRYPITVKKVPVKMGVSARAGVLQNDQMNAVANFARDAKYDSVSRIAIRYPSGSSKGRQAASDAATVVTNQGIPPEIISLGSYPGGAGAPLQLSYERKVAVTKECGDWSENLAYSPQNTDFPNFGCAYQTNVAAMVANAEDFEHPRAETPVVSANRVAAMKIYFDSATDVQSQTSTSTNVKDTTNSNTSTTSTGN